MTDEATSPVPDATMLRALCEEARSLAGDLPGPLRRLTLRAGDHAVEIAWGTAHEPPPRRVRGGAVEGATAAAELDRDDVEGRSIITAPLVGFFYRCPEPGAQPFVEEGEVVESGQDVAIVEGKNAMRHVQADRTGRVVTILAEEGHMVEFGQALMVLQPLDAGG